MIKYEKYCPVTKKDSRSGQGDHIVEANLIGACVDAFYASVSVMVTVVFARAAFIISRMTLPARTPPVIPATANIPIATA
jgi:hypothetical protein